MQLSRCPWGERRVVTSYLVVFSGGLKLRGNAGRIEVVAEKVILKLQLGNFIFISPASLL